jgi:hypothetical protein
MIKFGGHLGTVDVVANVVLVVVTVVFVKKVAISIGAPVDSICKFVDKINIITKLKLNKYILLFVKLNYLLTRESS